MKMTFDINSNDNSLFVTSQCNNKCLMCAQPPLNRDDIDFFYAKNIEIIDNAPNGLTNIGITGRADFTRRKINMLNRIHTNSLSR